MAAPKIAMKRPAMKRPAKAPAMPPRGRGRSASAPGQVKKTLGLKSAATLAKAKALARPVVPAGRKLPQTSGGPSFGALVRKTTADRKKLLPVKATPAASSSGNPFDQIGNAIGKIFPAGRSGHVKNATTTYGRLDKIIKGNR
jgi:hypothetical protein